MKANFLIIGASLLLAFACSKDDDTFPSELNVVNEPYSFKVYIGGTEVDASNYQPEHFFQDNQIDPEIQSLTFLNETEVNVAVDPSSDPSSAVMDYYFSNDSLYAIESGDVMYLGVGSINGIASQRSAFFYYGYRYESGEKVDVNYDEIINSDDKISTKPTRAYHLTFNDVLDIVGVPSSTDIEEKDTLVIYNFNLSYTK